MSLVSDPQIKELVEANEEIPTLHSVVGHIAYAMGDHENKGHKGLSNGDLAELRRIDVNHPYTPALWKVLLAFVPDAWTMGREQATKEKRWATLLMAMAINRGKHERSKRFGAALAEAGWSELRFVRLMEARDEALLAMFRQMAAFVSSKGITTNWVEPAKLLFEQDGERAETVRLNIAREYYRAKYRVENEKN